MIDQTQNIEDKIINDDLNQGEIIDVAIDPKKIENYTPPKKENQADVLQWDPSKNDQIERYAAPSMGSNAKIQAIMDFQHDQSREFAYNDSSDFTKAEQRWIYDQSAWKSQKEIDEGIEVFKQSNDSLINDLYYFDPETLQPKLLEPGKEAPIDPNTGVAMQLFGADGFNRFLTGMGNGAIVGAGAGTLIGGLPGTLIGGLAGGLLLGTVNAFGEDEDYIPTREGNDLTNDGITKTMLKTFNNTLLNGVTGFTALTKLASEGVVGNETIFSDLYRFTKQQSEASQFQINPLLPHEFQTEGAWDSAAEFFNGENYNMDALPVMLAQGLGSAAQFIGTGGAIKGLTKAIGKKGAATSAKVLKGEKYKDMARKALAEGDDINAAKYFNQAYKASGQKSADQITQFAAGMMINNAEIMEQLEGVEGLSIREKAAYGLMVTAGMSAIEMMGGPDAAILRNALRKSGGYDEVLSEMQDEIKKHVGKKMTGSALKKVHDKAYYSAWKKSANAMKQFMETGLSEAFEEGAQTAWQDVAATFTNKLYELDDETGFNADMASPETWSAYFNAAVAGFATGGLMGAPNTIKAGRIAGSVAMAEVVKNETNKTVYENQMKHYLSKKHITEKEYETAMQNLATFENYENQTKSAGLTRGQKKDVFVHMFELDNAKAEAAKFTDVPVALAEEIKTREAAIKEILGKAGEVDSRKTKANEKRAETKFKSEKEKIKKEKEDAEKPMDEQDSDEQDSDAAAMQSRDEEETQSEVPPSSTAERTRQIIAENKNKFDREDILDAEGNPVVDDEGRTAQRYVDKEGNKLTGITSVISSLKEKFDPVQKAVEMVRNAAKKKGKKDWESIDENSDEVQKQVAKFEFQRKAGILTHKIAEDLANGKSLSQIIAEETKKGSDPTIVSQTANEMAKFIKTVKKPNSTLVTEAQIVDQETGTVLIVDLMRVNPDGSVDIFDYKIKEGDKGSGTNLRKSYGSYINELSGAPQSSASDYAIQLKMAARALRKQGIKVNSTTIVPVGGKVEYSESTQETKDGPKKTRSFQYTNQKVQEGVDVSKDIDEKELDRLEAALKAKRPAKKEPKKEAPKKAEKKVDSKIAEAFERIDKAVSSRELDKILDQFDAAGITTPELLEAISKKRDQFSAKEKPKEKSIDEQIAELEKEREAALRANKIKDYKSWTPGETRYTNDGKKVVFVKSDRDKYGRGTDTITIDGKSFTNDVKIISVNSESEFADGYFANNIKNPIEIAKPFNDKIAALKPSKAPKIETDPEIAAAIAEVEKRRSTTFDTFYLEKEKGTGKFYNYYHTKDDKTFEVYGDSEQEVRDKINRLYDDEIAEITGKQPETKTEPEAIKEVIDETNQWNSAEVLEKIVEMNPRLAPIANTLIPFAKRLELKLNISGKEVKNAGGHAITKIINGKTITSINIYIDNILNTNVLNQQPDFLSEVIVHEEIHRLTQIVIELYKKEKTSRGKFQYLSESDWNFVSEIEELHKQYLKAPGSKDYRVGNDLHEFLAYGLTNAKFIEELSQIKIQNVSLLERLINSLIKLFGSSDQNLRDALVESFQNYMTQNIEGSMSMSSQFVQDPENIEPESAKFKKLQKDFPDRPAPGESAASYVARAAPIAKNIPYGTNVFDVYGGGIVWSRKSQKEVYVKNQNTGKSPKEQILGLAGLLDNDYNPNRKTNTKPSPASKKVVARPKVLAEPDQSVMKALRAKRPAIGTLSKEGNIYYLTMENGTIIKLGKLYYPKTNQTEFVGQEVYLNLVDQQTWNPDFGHKSKETGIPYGDKVEIRVSSSGNIIGHMAVSDGSPVVLKTTTIVINEDSDIEEGNSGDEQVKATQQGNNKIAKTTVNPETKKKFDSLVSESNEKEKPASQSEKQKAKTIKGNIGKTITNEIALPPKEGLLLAEAATMVERQVNQGLKLVKAVKKGWEFIKDQAEKRGIPITHKYAEIWRKSISTAIQIKNFDNYLERVEALAEDYPDDAEEGNDQVIYDEQVKSERFQFNPRVKAMYDSVPGHSAQVMYEELYDFVHSLPMDMNDMDAMLKQMFEHNDTLADFVDNFDGQFPVSDLVSLVNVIRSAKRRPHIALFTNQIDATGKTEKSSWSVTNHSKRAVLQVVAMINDRQKIVVQNGNTLTDNESYSSIRKDYERKQQILVSLIKAWNSNNRVVENNGVREFIGTYEGKEYTSQEIAERKIIIEAELMEQMTGLPIDHIITYLNSTPQALGYNSYLDALQDNFGENHIWHFIKGKNSDRAQISFVSRLYFDKNFLTKFEKIDPKKPAVATKIVSVEDFYKNLFKKRFHEWFAKIYKNEGYSADYFTVEGKRKTSAPLQSSVLDRADNILTIPTIGFYAGNKVLEYYQNEKGIPMPTFFIDGQKSVKNRIGATAGNVTADDKDFMNFMGYYATESDLLNEGEYLQNLGQFGDKSLSIFVPVKRHENPDAIIKEIRASGHPNAKHFPSNPQFVKKIAEQIELITKWNDIGQLGTGEDNRKYENDEQIAAAARDYVVQYAINKFYTDQIFFGRSDNYGKALKVNVDTTASWGKLKSQLIYSDQGVNTMRTSNKTADYAHFGNPFSEAGYPGTKKTISVPEAVQAYKDWLLNDYILYQDGNGVAKEIESGFKREQRNWILNEINSGKLDGKTLLYDKTLFERGLGTHAHALAEVIEKLRPPSNVIINKSKRGGSFASGGLGLMIGIEGGLEATYPEAIYNDSAITLMLGKAILDDKFENNDGIQFQSPGHEGRVQVSAGSAFTYKNSLKGLEAYIDNAGNPILDKCHTITLTRELAEMNPKVLMSLYEAMTRKKNRVDTVIFTSGAKLYEQYNSAGEKIDVVNYVDYDADGNMIGIDIKKMKIVQRDSSKLRIQQNLNNDGIVKSKRLIPQMLRHVKRLLENSVVDALLHEIVSQKAKDFNYSLSNMNEREKRDFIARSFTETNNTEDILEMLEMGTNVNHPILQAHLMTVLSSALRKNVLDLKAPGALLTTITDMVTKDELQGPRVVNGKTLPGECLVSPKSGLKARKGNIPGDRVFLTRMPADDLHSIAWVEVVGYLPASAGNKIALDKVSRFLAGEDQDGDQRHLWASSKNAYLDPESAEAKRKLHKQNIRIAQHNAIVDFFGPEWRYFVSEQSTIFKGAPLPLSQDLSSVDLDYYQKDLLQYLNQKFVNQEDTVLYRSEKPSNDIAVGKMKYRDKYVNSGSSVAQKLFDLLSEAYADPKNFETITSPVDTKRLDKYLTSDETETMNDHFSTDQTKIFEANKSTTGAGSVIGIVAKTLATFIEIAGNGIIMLDKSGRSIDYQSDLKNIYKLMGDVLNQATDNAKLQKLARLNITGENAGVWLAMAATGMSPRHIVKYFDKPFVKKYFTALANQKLVSDESVDHNTNPTQLLYEVHADHIREEISSETGRTVRIKTPEFEELEYRLQLSSSMFQLGQMLNVLEKGVTSWSEAYITEKRYEQMNREEGFGLKHIRIPKELPLIQQLQTTIKLAKRTANTMTVMGSSRVRKQLLPFFEEMAGGELNMTQAVAFERLVRDMIFHSVYDTGKSAEDLRKEITEYVATNGLINEPFFHYVPFEGNDKGDMKYGVERSLRHGADESIIAGAKNAYNQLPNELQELLMEYNHKQYGSSYSTKSGAFTRMIGNHKHYQLGAAMNKEVQTNWRTSDVAPISKENFDKFRKEMMPFIVRNDGVILEAEVKNDLLQDRQNAKVIPSMVKDKAVWDPFIHVLRGRRSAGKMRLSEAKKKYEKIDRKFPPSMEGKTITSEISLPFLFTAKNKQTEATKNNLKSNEQIEQDIIAEFAAKNIQIDLKTVTYADVQPVLEPYVDEAMRKDAGLNGTWQDDQHYKFYGKPQNVDANATPSTRISFSDPNIEDAYNNLIIELADKEAELSSLDEETMNYQALADEIKDMKEIIWKMKQDNIVTYLPPGPMSRVEFMKQMFPQFSHYHSVLQLPPDAQEKLNNLYDGTDIDGVPVTEIEDSYVTEFDSLQTEEYAFGQMLADEYAFNAWIKKNGIEKLENAINSLERDYKSLAADFPIRILKDRLAKERLVEMLREENQSNYKSRNIVTRAVYDLISENQPLQNEDWSKSKMISGSASMVSPSRLSESIMQLNETLIRERLRLFQAESKDLNDEFKEINREIKEAGADITTLTYTVEDPDIEGRSVQYFRKSNDPGFQQIQQAANNGDAKAIALMKFHKLFVRMETATGKYAWDNKEEAYRVPQAEADIFELLFEGMNMDNLSEWKSKLMDENIINTFKSTASSVSKYDDYFIDTSKLSFNTKNYGLNDTMTFEKIKSDILETMGSGASVSRLRINARAMRDLSTLQKYAENLESQGTDDSGAPVVIQSRSKIKPKVGFVKTATSTTNIAASIGKHYEGMIFKKQFEGIEPIMTFLENHLEGKGHQNMANWLKMHNSKVLYGKNSESFFGRHDKYINQMAGLTYFTMLGGNWVGTIPNAAAGFIQSFREMKVKHMLKAYQRLGSQIATNNPGKAFTANRALKLMKLFEIVSVSKDTEMNITRKNVTKMSNIIFMNIIAAETLNHAYSFIGSMTDAEYNRVAPLLDSGATRDQVLAVLGGANFDEIQTMDADKYFHFRKAGAWRVDQLQEETQRINGAYSKNARRHINDTAEGRAIMMFKNWMPELVLAHFSTEFIDMYGNNRKGILTSASDVLVHLKSKQGWKELMYVFHPTGVPQEKFQMMSQVDQNNIQKLMKELLLIGGLYLVYASLMGDDDEVLTRQQIEMRDLVERLYNESVFVFDPTSYTSIIKAPFPMATVIENIVRTATEFFKWDVYGSTTKYAETGDYKMLHYVEKNIPVFNQIRKTGTTFSGIAGYLND